MSELRELLDTQEDAVNRTLAENLSGADCPRLNQSKAAAPEDFVQVLKQCLGEESEQPAHNWAANIRSQIGYIPFAEVLTVLSRVELVARYFLVKTVSQKKALLPALTELSDTVDMMRRACASDAQQAEQSLAEAQARKRSILESALDPIITLNHEGRITEFNKAAEQVFGHPRDKVLGTQPSEILFPPSVSAERQDRIDRYLEVGEGSMLGKRVEVTAVCAGGESFPAEMAMTISHEQGAPVMTFFIRDLSERKKAERKQARYASELERSNRELEDFAYVASHDLQEPLRKIRMFGDRLEMKCGEMLDETGTECVGRMRDAATRMQSLIDGLLTLSRITTRAQNFERVDLKEVADEVVSDLEAQIEEVEGLVEVGKLPTIHADRLQMRQLLQNLIGNALKFRRPEEPPVVKVQGGFVKGRGQRAAGQSATDELCRILVSDNGIGFDEKYADRVFDVFQRLHPRDVYEGTGVGLAICRKIVERHGGSIVVNSEPQRGTTFEIVLPVIHPKKTK